MGHPATGVNHNVRPAEGQKVAAKLNSKVTYRAVSKKSVHLAAAYLVGQGTSGLLGGLATPQIYSAALNRWERHAVPRPLISHHMRGSHAMACQGVSCASQGSPCDGDDPSGKRGSATTAGKALWSPASSILIYKAQEVHPWSLFLCHAAPQKFRRTPSCVRPTTPGRPSSLDF